MNVNKKVLLCDYRSKKRTTRSVACREEYFLSGLVQYWGNPSPAWAWATGYLSQIWTRGYAFLVPFPSSDLNWGYPPLPMTGSDAGPQGTPFPDRTRERNRGKTRDMTRETRPHSPPPSERQTNWEYCLPVVLSVRAVKISYRNRPFLIFQNPSFLSYLHPRTFYHQ